MNHAGRWVALAALPVLVACGMVVMPPVHQPPEPDAYLFSYFMRNGADGVHLAWSGDGITWKQLNHGRAVLGPTITGAGRGWQEWNTTAALMRDPSILRGPDGVFHLVWTIAWSDRGIGVAHSRNLRDWSDQVRIPVMDHESEALNARAPDLFYDAATAQYVIVWATAIPGRFPATDTLAQVTSRGRADHRLYFVTTPDFKVYSHAKLLYDGGFSAVDGTIAKSGDLYYLIMKDETLVPPARNLRVAVSRSATGPYGPASAAFTDKDTEGPSVLRIGEWHFVYYDEYARGQYAAVRTRDFEHWEPLADSLKTPRGIRHGSAFLAPESILKGLRARDSLAP